MSLGGLFNKADKFLDGFHKTVLRFKFADGTSKDYSVMINPDSITKTCGHRIQRVSGTGTDALEGSYIINESGSGEETTSMDLIFDVVDIYDLSLSQQAMSKTFGSIVGFAGKKDNEMEKFINNKMPTSHQNYKWGSHKDQISVLNINFSALPYIIAASGGDAFGVDKRPESVVIKWGQFLEEGMIKSLHVRYDYFSPSGMPLRAKIVLYLQRMPVKQEQASMKNDKVINAKVTEEDYEDTSGWD